MATRTKDVWTEEKIEEWREEQADEELEKLESVLWKMAELRVKSKPEFKDLVRAEHSRVYEEAERALVMKYKKYYPG